MTTSLFKSKLLPLFLLGGLTEAILLPSIHEIVSKSGLSAEAADISVLFVLLIYTGALLLYASTGAKNIETILSKQSQFWTGQLFFLILLFSASIITVFPGYEGQYWFGYGQKIVIISLILTPLLIALNYKNNARLDSILSIITYSLTLLFYIPSIFQPPWGVIDFGHSLYVVNELLAPQSGNYPLVNFSAQYTSLLGYVFNLLFSSHGTVDQAFWFLTILALFTIVIALIPVTRAFPKDKRYLALAFTIPAIFIVKLNEDSYSGSLSALFSALPVRLIFPSVIALILTSNLYQHKKSTCSISIGVICSFAILNNLESGVVSTIAALFVIVLYNRPKKWIYQVTLFCSTSIASLALILLVLQATFGKIHSMALFDFVGGFGGGFGATAMPTFGLWVFAFVFLSMGTIVAALHIHTSANAETGPDINLSRASIIALFWGLFGIGMSPYYINRSVVSGQLQFILFSVFLSSAGLFLLVAKSYGRSALRNMALIIALLPGAISTASIVQHPSFFLARERLKPTNNSFSDIFKLQISGLKETISQIRANNIDKKIGLYANFGSILSQPLSLPSYLPVNNQFDLNIIARSMAQQICTALQLDNITFLIATGLSEETLKIVENCGYVLYFSKPNHLIYIKSQILVRQ